jgi:hypothetical protein
MTEQLQLKQPVPISELHVYPKTQSQDRYSGLKAWLTSIDPRLGECIEKGRFVLSLAKIENVTLGVSVNPQGMKKFTFGFDVKF